MSIQIIRGRPSFLTAAQKNDAATLIARSGLLNSRSALSRINRAFLVLIGYKNGTPTATLTVKTPEPEYVANVFRRAQVKQNGESLELGYLYAEPGSGAVFNGPKLYRNAMEVV